jgi:hypothetical protein
VVGAQAVSVAANNVAMQTDRKDLTLGVDARRLEVRLEIRVVNK